MKNIVTTLVAGTLGLSLGAVAQNAPAPCSAPESRQFDFWIGDWDVYVPSGKRAGTNHIERMYGCMLHESWKSASVEGQSFNGFDTTRGLWHQTWIDSSGSVLVIEGGMHEGSMSMSDRNLAGKKDVQQVNEITWTPNADGSVRQHWRVSADGGKTWTTSFDGKYVRSNRTQPK
ncbi:MAG TPA: hypothetical protein VLJ84_08160 [Usitatibacter sp.]|nr:hypothetical protein [Usitatibacter sp.]